MFVLENGDKIQGYASAATVVDFHISGLTGTTLKNLADGQLPVSIGDLYTSSGTDLAKTIVLTNTDSVARTINLYHTPSSGTARRILPKDMSIAAGGTILFDGENVSVLSSDGGLVSSVSISDGSVTIEKIEDIATDSFLGRDTAGSGAVEVLSKSAVQTILDVSGTNTGDEAAASTTVAGVIELATTAEVNTGTATNRAVTPDAFEDSAAIQKLNAIEASADVTDAANVDSAGAVMNSDATTASMSFVIDEDDLSTDSNTKVPTQQSVKAYVDALGGTTYAVAQTSHGLSVGNLIKSSGTDSEFAKAQADSVANAEVVGVVTASSGANNFVYQAMSGLVEVVAVVPTETAGTVLFLDPDTAGAMTTTDPTALGDISKPIGIVTASNAGMLMVNLRGIEITSGVDGDTLSLSQILHTQVFG